MDLNGSPLLHLLSDVYKPVVPNHCSGDHKCSGSNLEVLPEKFVIHNTLGYKQKFDSRYEGFSNHFIVRCSTTFKRLGNTDINHNFNLERNGSDYFQALGKKQQIKKRFKLQISCLESFLYYKLLLEIGNWLGFRPNKMN